MLFSLKTIHLFCTWTLYTVLKQTHTCLYDILSFISFKNTLFITSDTCVLSENETWALW